MQRSPRRYDPHVARPTHPDPRDDVLGLEMVKGWREIVWRNAERLPNATGRRRAQAISEQIKTNAADWARGMAAVEQGGYRETRDAYCRAKLGQAG